MIDSILLIFSGAGIGGVLGIFAKSLLDKQHLKFSKIFEYKEARYKANIRKELKEMGQAYNC